jgi:hypothetical protein
MGPVAESAVAPSTGSNPSCTLSVKRARIASRSPAGTVIRARQTTLSWLAT